MKKILQSLCGIAILLTLVTGSAFAQGSTTASMSGKVLDTKGEQLIGATILATHKPSGTKYGAVSNTEGRFVLPNVRIGGPYYIEVTYVGYQRQQLEGINLSLGERRNLEFILEDETSTLEEVVVKAQASDVINSGRTGAETTITADDINKVLPTLTRSIGDMVRLTPQANITEGGDGFSISIGGQNNRYNAIYIDGAVNNDVFGLAGSGTNGGQTGVSPISLDAIEQFQVAIAPFDVTQSGFAGGSINAVTRSGSNEFEGSAYVFHRNESLAGKTPTDREDIERTKLDDFSATTYGARLGGPIIKDKAFFFVNVELQDDQTPQPFDFQTYEGDATLAQLNSLEQKLNGFGYDPGGFTNNTAFLKSEKVIARLDFNLSQNHKLMLRHSYTGAENLEAVRSNTRNINYLNSSEFFPGTTNSSALELKSTLGTNIGNSLILGYTRVRDDRDPSGDPFPYVSIRDGDGSISFGSEQFSTANQLDQDIFTITNNLELYKGNHTITFGTHNEFYSVYNLFIRQNFGSYQFNSLQDFINDSTAFQYDRSYSLVDDITGDGSAAGTEFTAMQLGFYVQDRWQVSKNLNLTAGIRVDIPMFTSNTPENTDFNETTVPLIESFGYDLKGARTGEFVDPQFMFAPRFGFNWDPSGKDETQVRGGIGVFNSRVPLVWPGGAYNNNGSLVGGDRRADVPFNPNWDEQPRNVAPNSGERSGQVDLFASDFKFPQVWKLNLAVDQQLPWGMIGTLEFLYTGNVNAIYYENINLKPSTEQATGTPDNRNLYDRFDEIDPTYTGIYLASNTAKGYSYNLTAQLQKQFSSGFGANVSYTYGDAYAIYDGTSSQNSSQWRGLNTVNGRNLVTEAQRSDFSSQHRVMGSVTYRKEYFNFGATQISLFYNGQTGNPYSYILNEFGGNRSSFANEDSRQRSLIYVPASADEIIFGSATDRNVAVPGTAAEQQAEWNRLNDFIENDPYLKDKRGEYVERNSNFAPFNSILDLKLIQDFFITTSNGKKNTLQLSLDVFNLGNLLNPEWGRIYFVPSNYELLQFQGFQENTNTPVYSTSIPENNEPWKDNINDRGIRTSRWQAQIGVRYIFGN